MELKNDIESIVKVVEKRGLVKTYQSKVEMPDVVFYLLKAYKKEFPDMYFVKLLLLNTFKDHTMLLFNMFRQKSDSLKLTEVLRKNEITFDMAVGCLKALG